MSIALCFSGGIGSGKTTLASAVAERFSVTTASFGRFVRHAAKERGISEEREMLQALGEKLIAELGWPTFCGAVLDESGWKPGSTLVIDGIRHVAAFEAVRDLVAPMPASLIFVAVPRELRQTRVDERIGEQTDLAKAELHSTEAQVREVLRGKADLIVDGTRDLFALVEQVYERFK